VLQKLLLLVYNLFDDSNGETTFADSIRERLKEQGLHVSYSAMVFALKASDVQSIINCSERTAKEYISALQTILLAVDQSPFGPVP